MKKLLAAALLALSVATPAQAQAVSSSDIATTKAIITKLVQVGVTIATPTICPDDIWGKYDHSTATLTLCPETLRNDAMAVETVSHEAIHAAQHCVGGPLAGTVPAGGEDAYAKGLATAIGYKAQHVIRSTEGLSETAKLREYEAYAFEAHPEIVLSILNKVCR